MNRPNSKCFAILAIATTILCAQPAIAAKYALLIGVSKYQYMPSEGLEGPAHDVAALKGVLQSAWGFKSANITTLVNQQASKAAILAAIKGLIAKTGPGDFVFIYFSGHGTSAYDLDKKKLGLDPFTGAIAPADVKAGSVEEMLSSLIVGNRDLRPLFSRLEKGPEVLVAFDTCYAGYSVRGMRSMRGTDKGLGHRSLPSRYLRLPWPTRSLAGDLTGDGTAAYEQGTIKEPPYPYKKLVYLAASARHEKADDITSWHLENGYSTVDHQPHGAMTDALLKALVGWADLNGDRKITHRELYQFVRGDVSRRFQHTPRLLYNTTQARGLDAPLFGTHKAAFTPRMIDPGRDLRVALENVSPAARQRIAGITGIEVADSDYDLLVSREEGAYKVFLFSGFPLTSRPPTSEAGLIELLKRQVAVKRLAGLVYPKQGFNVFLDLMGANGVLIEGDKVGFVIKPDRDSYILLIDIDPAGKVYVIYPADLNEIRPAAGGKELRLPNQGEVVPPHFGQELIKVFAFSKKPEGLKRLAGKSFWPHAPLFAQLMKMVEKRHGVAQATIRVKSAPKRDVVVIE